MNFFFICVGTQQLFRWFLTCLLILIFLIHNNFFSNLNKFFITGCVILYVIKGGFVKWWGPKNVAMHWRYMLVSLGCTMLFVFYLHCCTYYWSPCINGIVANFKVHVKTLYLKILEDHPMAVQCLHLKLDYAYYSMFLPCNVASNENICQD